MPNRYENTELPEWVNTASRDDLIKHIQYLTHNNKTTNRALAKARRRYKIAENELKNKNQNK